MSKPITSRVKRSPLFKYNAPLKQTNPLGKSVKVGGSEEGKDEIINRKDTKIILLMAQKMSDKEWAALTPEKRRKLNAVRGSK